MIYSIIASDYTSQAWSAASGNGATISPPQGPASSSAFDINISAWSAGASSGITFYLSESYDGGTTWYDLWQTEEKAATGHIRIPPISIYGQHRIRWVNRGGAATTATVSVTSCGILAQCSTQRQWFDRTITLTSLSSATPAFLIDGCDTVSMYLVVTGGTPATPPVITLQVSQNGSDWGTTSTTVSPTGAGSFVATATVAARFARAIVTTASAGGTAYTLGYVGIQGVGP